MNQNPEQLARDRIDEQRPACGWTIQDKKSINLHAAIGVAVRENGTDVGPADYLLFVGKKPVGIIEVKRAEEGVHLTVHEEKSHVYAESKLKYLNNDPLPFVYESTSEVTRFTDAIGVTKSLKTDSRTMKKRPSIILKVVLEDLQMISATIYQKVNSANIFNLINK